MNRLASAYVSQALLITAWLTTALLSNGGAFCATAEKPVFRAGAATSNITPPLGEMIVGGWQPVPATHIHDELHARCLVLDNGLEKLIVVLCDNVGIPQEVFDQAKQRIQQHTGVPSSHQLMAATHTHSATTARGESKVARSAQLTAYQSFLAQRIVDGVRRAINQLEPARIGWSSCDEPGEVFNRRWYVNDTTLLSNPFGGVDRVRMNPPRGSAALDRPAGPTDPEISFVFVKSIDGRPIALLANYSLHYVGGVPAEDVSADYFGYFARIIADKLSARDQSPPFVGILSNGTSGDVNNIDFTGSKRHDYAHYEKMQEVAESVAERVYDAHQKLTFHDWVALAAAQTDLTLKVRKPSAEMLAYFESIKGDDESAASARHSRSLIYAERVNALLDAPREIQVPLQAFQIGELGIAAIPFETFAETGLQLKQEIPFADAFTIELANGSFGYLPTPEQHRLGGYETWLGTNYVEKDASKKIVATLLQLFQELVRQQADRPLIAGITKETLWRNRDGRRQTWFHPRACMLPGSDGQRIALMTLQPIGGSDYFGPVHWSMSADLGRNWSQPEPIASLGREFVFDRDDGLQAAVCDVTPQFHPPTQSLIALGHVVFYKGDYFARDEQLPRYPVYAIRAQDGTWSPRRILQWNDPRGSHIYSNNCGQRVVLPNGDVQMSFTFGSQPQHRMVAGVRATFDGEQLRVSEVGPALHNPHERGLLEPSVTWFRDKFYMTMRAEDHRGYVAVSEDGLNWDDKRAWTWQDGTPLQMSSTQQHWLTHSDGLFLVYTRRDASNVNVIRWRSPLWVAQVDPAGCCLIKASERVVLELVGDGVDVPDEVALMGNFSVTNAHADESWVTVGEWIPRSGYRGDVLLARIRWSKPNQLALSP